MCPSGGADQGAATQELPGRPGTTLVARPRHIESRAERWMQARDEALCSKDRCQRNDVAWWYNRSLAAMYQRWIVREHGDHHLAGSHDR